MRWPWVSRSAVDVAEALVAQYEAAFANDRQRWLDSYRDLLDKYHELKLQGAAPSIESISIKQPKSTDQADEEAAMDDPVVPVPVYHDDD